MTQEKMRKTITAVVVAATVLLVVLLSVLIYGWVKIGVLNRREEKLNNEIAALEQIQDESEATEAWSKGPGRFWLALEQGWVVKQGDN